MRWSQFLGQTLFRVVVCRLVLQHSPKAKGSYSESDLVRRSSCGQDGERLQRFERGISTWSEGPLDGTTSKHHCFDDVVGLVMMLRWTCLDPLPDSMNLRRSWMAARYHVQRHPQRVKPIINKKQIWIIKCLQQTIFDGSACSIGACTYQRSFSTHHWFISWENSIDPYSHFVTSSLALWWVEKTIDPYCCVQRR